MVEHIHIKNFKSIVNLELELGKLNVFIGENGCGKTNILEAITLGAAAVAHKLDSEFLITRGIRVADKDLMKSAFNPFLQRAAITIIMDRAYREGIVLYIESSSRFSAVYTKDEKDVHLNGKNFFDSNPDVVLDSFNEEFFKSRPKEVLEYINETKKFLNYAPENYFLRRFEEEGQIRPLGIRGEGLFKHLVDIYKKQPELLKEIGEHLRLIGWFEGFEIPTDLMFTERRINIKDKYLQELDFFDQRSANEGFLYLLFYFTLFLSPFTPKFFAIDNIDNALNPKLCAELIRQLVKISKENDKQTILTTHNPAILDGLDLTDDSQRLFTIYRNSEGHTEAKRIKAPKKVKGVEPVRLSEAYIRGYLGGLPKNF